MSRIKISENFYLDELVCPELYLAMEGYEGRIVAQLKATRIIETVQGLRTYFGASTTINNWLTGGDRKYSGIRPHDCPIGAKASWHKLGYAADMLIEGISPIEAGNAIVEKYPLFKGLGLTAIENPRITKTWLHVSTQPTWKEKIVVFNP